MNYIDCPTCRVSHQLPQGGANCLPNDFKINTFQELRRKLTFKKSAEKICPKHNDPLKVYCETCRKVICRDCTISEEHNKHHLTCQLISDCYPKHHQQIQDDLGLLKHKTADITTAVTTLVTREKEVVQQGEEIKEQIHTHAQQLIDQVQRSERHLLQQVDTVVQQKRHLLTKQREQAERVHTQLKTCQDTVEQSLKEWSQLQVMMEKENILHQIKTFSQDVDPTVFQPIEKPNTKFKQTAINIENGIGMISSYRYGEAILKTMPCSPSTSLTATLTLQSHDGSPFSLPPSLISCKLSSPGACQPIKCDINQTQQGKYNISLTRCTAGAYQVIVQVGGVDIYGSPFTLPVIPSSVLRGKPVKTINRLNKPQGIAVCDNRDIVFAEHGKHCVTIVNKEGKKVRSFGTRGTNEGQFTYPRGVAISNDGHILVTDNHRLQKMTFDGVCVQTVGSSKSGSGQLQFNYPGGITVYPTTGQTFVVDSSNNRIQVFNNDLTFSHTITLNGDKAFNPWDVSLDSEGHLYVAEWGNHCITKLTTTGQYIARFGTKGSDPGQLYCPSSLTINNNLVYVSDHGNHRVSVFNTKGTHFHCFGKRGSGGEFNYPYGITTDTNGNLYVSDSDNNRVVIY